MEKIEIYQYPSIFVSSQYFEFAEDLKKKIEKDRIVFCNYIQNHCRKQ